MPEPYAQLKKFISKEIDRKQVALIPILELIEKFDIDESDNQEMQRDITKICHQISDDLRLEASFQFSSEFVEFRKHYDA